MDKRFITMPAAAIAAAVVSFQAGASDLQVTPGQLKAASVASCTDTELRLTGSADVRDLTVLAESLPAGVTSLDLSGLTVEAYTAPRPLTGGRSVFAASELPAFIFLGLRCDRLELPSTLVSIGEGALAGSGLTSVVIPESVRTVGAYAFKDCSRLAEADLSRCRLTCLEEETLAGCTSLTGLTLPAGLAYIGPRVLAGTALTDLTAAQVSEYDDFALAGMEKLERAVLNPGARFGCGTLMGCPRLTEVRGVPSDVPDMFAARCRRLHADQLAGGATTLGAYCAAAAYGGFVTLGPGITYVASGAFDDAQMGAIDATALDDRVPPAADDAFGDMDLSRISLYVEPGTGAAWRAAEPWNRMKVSDNVSVEQIPGAAGVTVRTDVSGLTVSCPSGMDEVCVYAVDGRCLARAVDAGTEWTMQWAGSVPAAATVGVRTGDGAMTVRKVMVR